MVKYRKEFKEQVLLLSDALGVKKAAERLGSSYYTISEWRKARSRKAKDERTASDKTPLKETACHAARNTGAEKSKV